MLRCSKARTSVRRSDGSDMFHVRLLTLALPNVDRETHRNNELTLELSTLLIDYVPFVGLDVLWAVCTYGMLRSRVEEGRMRWPYQLLADCSALTTAC